MSTGVLLFTFCNILKNFANHTLAELCVEYPAIEDKFICICFVSGLSFVLSTIYYRTLQEGFQVKR